MTPAMLVWAMHRLGFIQRILSLRRDSWDELNLLAIQFINFRSDTTPHIRNDPVKILDPETRALGHPSDQNLRHLAPGACAIELYRDLGA